MYYEGDHRHNEIIRNINELERSRNKVALGFILFWLLYACLVAGAVWYFLF